MTRPLVPDLAAYIEAARHDKQIHHHPSAYVRSHEDSRGRCGWRWHWEDSTIYCWAPDLPGAGYCIHHASQQPDIVTFPATVIDAGTLQIAGDAE